MGSVQIARVGDNTYLKEIKHLGDKRSLSWERRTRGLRGTSADSEWKRVGREPYIKPCYSQERNNIYI